MKQVEVTRLECGEVHMESTFMPDIRFHNQEDAHTWLALNGYKIIDKPMRPAGDNISGTYVKPIGSR